MNLLPETVSLGSTSEEPLEQSHKVIKNDEKNHVRQDSRVHRMTDLVTRGFCRSDPKYQRYLYQKRVRNLRANKKSLPKEVLDLCDDFSDSDDDFSQE